MAEWLETRTPVPPPALAARIAEVLGASTGASADDTGKICVDAAESLLGELLSRRNVGRESALDLLTVDALATYAFEAASGDPITLNDRARDAMRRFATAATA